MVKEGKEWTKEEYVIYFLSMHTKLFIVQEHIIVIIFYKRLDGDLEPEMHDGAVWSFGMLGTDT